MNKISEAPFTTMLDNYSHMLWDFDGVILDSNPIRDLGFEQIFSDFDPAQVNQLMQYHRNNGGLSRFVKIRYFFEQVLHTPVSEATVQEYAARFSGIMRNLLCNKQLLIKDAVDYIQQHAASKRFHIVSASAEAELKFVCGQLGISRYFISLHGSPATKIDNVRLVLQQYGYQPSNTCLIGDSHNDAQAASVNHLPFFGYHSAKLEADTSLGYVYSFLEGKYRAV